ncbi:MAG: chemotaxis protein CheA [Gammaproteobacteria bacterium]|jgi:two-component system chemotaxis sensor kinase CheA|nr:chemotaxis protein CheA [Gammaproteobacteria bacterium]
MTIDLAQFHDAFFEESFEALDSMEAALLKLDIGAPDKELINTIFRVAHSIKGGSATFGFSDIASFTHSLETMLDELRSGGMQVTLAMSDLLLKSVDVMRAMLRAVQQKQPINTQRVSDLQFDLELMIAQKNSAPAAAPATALASVTPPAPPEPVVAAPPSAPVQAPVADTTPRRWVISFRPYTELFARGNDPLRMMRELAELGELESNADVSALPAFADLQPQSCYLAWNLVLTGDVTESAIRQVFEWAEGDCDLQITLANGAAQATSPAAAQDSTSGAAVSVTPVAAAAVAAAEPASNPAATAPVAAAPAAPAPVVPIPVAEVPAAAAPIAPAPATAPTAVATQKTEAAAPVATVADSGSIRVSVEKIDELMNTVGELVITQAMLSQLGSKLEGPTAEKLRGGLAQLERNMRELQESVMRVRMLPINVVFSRFPRMVRDLAQRLGKQVELKLTGEQTELDKTVLEKIGDPLVHLVRNSIDHGIEAPDKRTAAGKPAAGTVHLDACHRGGNIAVEVSDDGGGLDKDRILAKARDRGLVGPNDVLTDEQIYDLIFLPGFSTAEKTTDVSGRGVGMDVVRRNIKELGGKIELRSEHGQGSKTIITLPLTLAIVDGQSVSVGSETYIVPLISIVESMQLKAADVSRLSGRGEVFSFRGFYLPIVRLYEVFGVEPHTKVLDEGLVVVAEGEGHQRIGLFVDDLLGQQQVVIKSLEANYGHVEGVSGATILGDGSVALILDIPGLIRAMSMRAAA